MDGMVSAMIVDSMPTTKMASLITHMISISDAWNTSIAITVYLL